ncbi:MAG: diaminopimelate decarboxylase [Candidatus Handelsmanbacteria bacterium RIFCSPLOWO2_12_FULL_64_10]|uniref:Diaminopimelate decarboxylase n=1 Tax=Handelsmanbacteria sp. (strain RIFCSPLOWO2_12_FULL_64_10) TaxID=1817868 RepID=A0A1F6CVQ1_HANXR|nr:MAG: diaminopimelate decarboxylase [Candidatus Handelsmanbacteria bacterium RIFCSPLOWO2_12_FULL_64_10]
MEIRDNKLFLGGLSAEQLVAEFGSPLYVYEEDTLRRRIHDLKTHITYPDLRIHYACKANTNVTLMRILREEGAYLDAVAPGEVFLALRAGYRPEHILYTGNSTSRADLEFCKQHGLLVNVESLTQLDAYGEMNPGALIAVRINPDVGAGHHNHCITGGPDSKFGIYQDRIGDVMDRAGRRRLQIVGLHSHIGSGILDLSIYLEVMDIILRVAQEFRGLEFIDFGGGIGVPYRPGERPIDMPAFGKAVTEKFSAYVKSRGRQMALAIEPGRYLVCESGFLLTPVNNVKETPKHKFVGTDTGFNHLIRPMAYGSYHEILNASGAQDGREAVVVAGNICESGDVFTRDEHGPVDRELSRVRIGDVLAICNAGAYGFSMASNYNSRPRPAEILVKDGQARVIRRAETMENLLYGME